MECCQVHVCSIPKVRGQRSCGIGMGLSHIIPILDHMGYLWSATMYQIRSNPIVQDNRVITK